MRGRGEAVRGHQRGQANRPAGAITLMSQVVLHRPQRCSWFYLNVLLDPETGKHYAIH